MPDMTLDQALQLAMQFHATGRLDNAENLLREVLKFNPRNVQALHQLGVLLVMRDKKGEGIILLRKVLQATPSDPGIYSNLGLALHGTGKSEEAEMLLRRAIELDPNFAGAMNNLGNVLRDLGRVGEALEFFREAIRVQPEFSLAWDNLLFTMQFGSGITATEIRSEHLKWNEWYAAPLTSSLPHQNDKSKDRKLRIGYLGGHFWSHCQALFLMPLLANHDHEKFEVFCYTTSTRDDEKTAQLRSFADHWRMVAHSSDEQIAVQIREDKIDVLVDLAMHMSGGRPLAVARKPAPVQIAWLAYPGTDGMTAVDYRITDPVLDPAGMDESIYVERTLRLPDTFWCYDPLASTPVGELPAAKNGYVTFGCLNNFAKVNDETLALWRRVFDARGGKSRMVIMAAPAKHRKWVEEALGPNVDVKFVEYRPRSEYLKSYGKIDICLDTFPYNGHTTSLDASWMGVPVVTWASAESRVVGRAGLSLQTNLGLTSLCGSSEDEFVRIASDLASDLPRLAAIRASLRERMEASPLMDGARFARGMEQAFRAAWTSYSEG